MQCNALFATAEERKRRHKYACDVKKPGLLACLLATILSASGGASSIQISTAPDHLKYTQESCSPVS
jgi:hypothetical protein